MSETLNNSTKELKQSRRSVESLLLGGRFPRPLSHCLASSAGLLSCSSAPFKSCKVGCRGRRRLMRSSSRTTRASQSSSLRCGEEVVEASR